MFTQNTTTSKTGIAGRQYLDVHTEHDAAAEDVCSQLVVRVVPEHETNQRTNERGGVGITGSLLPSSTSLGKKLRRKNKAIQSRKG